MPKFDINEIRRKNNKRVRRELDKERVNGMIYLLKSRIKELEREVKEKEKIIEKLKATQE